MAAAIAIAVVQDVPPVLSVLIKKKIKRKSNTGYDSDYDGTI